ncbi:uncharacterized protein F4822DRAFT_384495 [Hypoxylon trugodes]|uniref:uncharacterized protein n=1 Tax=Hypoxylon trugodes TaxID=326681 RepID=UPI002191D41E|nr:uncharacterized protein F4822DRAFT_384495 [Hypoxylon trugodes]KAI1393390.1 hypothetical protein F4822DRAFT_384495 [Hypoxylon trugodes]
MLPRISRSRFRRAGRFNTPSQLPSAYTRSFASSTSHLAIKADQTKKGNDPSSEQKEEHHEQATQTASSESREHPAKQPDPQPSPSKSTGVRSEGPGESKAGEGVDRGVHKERGAGAGQHRG